MKKIVILMTVLTCLLTSTVQAVQGDNGYQGGVSASTGWKDTYDYQEVVFITGKPVVFSGEVKIKRSVKDDHETITYDYDLKHGESDTLKRKVVFTTNITKKNDQIVKETVLKSKPSERINIDGVTYILNNNNMTFSMSTITDDRPAVDYFAGNWNGKKVYNVGDGETITVTATGQLYGYDQYWGNTETQEIRFLIEGQVNQNGIEKSWGGRAEVKSSSTSAQKLLYVDNRPNEISFEGGYLQRQEDNSVLNYTATLPVFDANGDPTDRMITYKDDLNRESFPKQTRLVIPDLKKMKGHWAENAVKQLYSLEIYNGNAADFMPNQYMTRAEFAKAIILAGKIAVEEEKETKRVNPRLRRNQQQEEQPKVSPYTDVPLNHPYYKYIDALYKTGAMAGYGSRFNPDGIIDRAQALTIFIRVLGLESLAPNPTAVTTFRDNDHIPEWARNAVKVAAYIGLVRGDEYGYLHPNAPMTKAQASEFLNRLVNYMRSDIVRDYRDRVLIY